MTGYRKNSALLFFIGGMTSWFMSCAVAKQDTEYRKLAPPENKKAAYTIKAEINSISNDSFASHIYTGNNGDTVRYRVLKPTTIDASARYPLILILPTSAGIGTDNTNQINVLVKLWAQSGVRNSYPAYVVAPQFTRRSSNYVMDKDRGVLVSVPDDCLSAALQLIDSLSDTWSVDKNRVYAMGFSMGASATINALGLKPDLFAAAVAISGVPDFSHVSILQNKPVWFIHGNADDENPFAADSLMRSTLQHLHSKRTRFWEIHQLAHEIYPPLYTSNMIPEWLFRHSK